ncbi:MAG: hypothetical protein NTW86_00150 [Candidatus Sumerlaeota bacterium]|nr:hypothetical protein [Candidatus Sumerlaeota bacterium]
MARRMIHVELVVLLLLCLPCSRTACSAPLPTGRQESRETTASAPTSDTLETRRQAREEYEKVLASPDVQPWDRDNAKRGLAFLLIPGFYEPNLSKEEIDLERAIRLCEELQKEAGWSGDRAIASCLRAMALAHLKRGGEAENQLDAAIESIRDDGGLRAFWLQSAMHVLTTEGKPDGEKARWFLNHAKQSPETPFGEETAWYVLLCRDDPDDESVAFGREALELLRKYHPNSQHLEGSARTLAMAADMVTARKEGAAEIERQREVRRAQANRYGTPSTSSRAAESPAASAPNGCGSGCTALPSAPASRSAADVPPCCCGSGATGAGASPTGGAQLGCGCGSPTPAPLKSQ